MHFKMSSGKWQPFSLDLKVLMNDDKLIANEFIAIYHINIFLLKYSNPRIIQKRMQQIGLLKRVVVGYFRNTPAGTNFTHMD